MPWATPCMIISHYSDVMMGTMASQITSLTIHCLLNRLSRSRSKKTSKLRVTGLYAGNSPVTCEFPAQMVSNEEIVSFWCRHHAYNGPLAKSQWRPSMYVIPGETEVLCFSCRSRHIAGHVSFWSSPPWWFSSSLAPLMHLHHQTPGSMLVCLSVTSHERHGVSNQWQPDSLFNSVFKITITESSKLAFVRGIHRGLVDSLYRGQ